MDGLACSHLTRLGSAGPRQALPPLILKLPPTRLALRHVLHLAFAFRDWGTLGLGF